MKIINFKISQIFLVIALCIIPLLIHLFLQYKFGVNVPFWDDWEMVDLYRLWIADGNLKFTDLWEPHNEHRILIANLIGLGIIYLTNFNTLVAMYLATAIKVLLFFLILGLLKTTFGKKNYLYLNGFAILTSILLFSIHDGELLTWGIPNLYWNVFLLFQFLMFYELTLSPDSWRGVILASVSVMLCSLIISNGLILFFVGGLQIFLQSLLNRKKLFTFKLFYWIFAMIVFLLIYFFGYSPSNTEGIGTFLIRLKTNFHVVIGFFFIYMGSIMIPFSGGVMGGIIGGFVGIFGVFTFLFFLYILARYYPDKIVIVLPWILISVNVLLGALLTMYGRAKFGAGSAGASRYMALSRFFWLSLFVIAIFLFDIYSQKRSLDIQRISYKFIVLLMLFLLPIFVSNFFAFSKLQPHWLRFSKGLQSVYHYKTASKEGLELLYPDYLKLLPLIIFLEKFEQGPFSGNSLRK